MRQKKPEDCFLEIFLVDDGSTDGTAEMVRQNFPAVRIFQGDGNLFWSGGMRLAFDKAYKSDFDFYWWLNDDTLISPDALTKMLETHSHVVNRYNTPAIIVGSVCNAETGKTTYGGVIRKSRWRAMRFTLLTPADNPQTCDTFNGNCVLVSRKIAGTLGNLDPVFTHRGADTDYGLRAKKAGYTSWLVPGFVGTCSQNPIATTFLNRSVSLKKRWQTMFHTKGLPLKPWFVLTRRHAGWAWPIYWITPYLRVTFEGMMDCLRFSHNKAVDIPSRKSKICIIQEKFPEYRWALFKKLRESLQEQNIELIVIYGTSSAANKNDRISEEMPGCIQIQNRYFKIGSKRTVCWQPCLKYLRGADLVIVEQASRMLINYLLLIQQKFKKLKLAFWGHGKKLDINESVSWSEHIKRWVSRRVSWWFAYNEFSAKIVQAWGFPAGRITCVQNTIDIQALIEIRQSINKEQLNSLKLKMGITGRNIGLFSGTMYSQKRVGFLLEAVMQIRKKVPDFEMIFIGDGPDDYLIKRAAETKKWIHYVGTKFETEKVPYWMLADVLLIPGIMGLAIIDSFAMEVPLVTTNVTGHGPEIDYLQNGINGIMVAPYDDSTKYSDAVVKLLENKSEYNRLTAGCRAAQQTYTIENMVKRFSAGIQKALEQ